MADWHSPETPLNVIVNSSGEIDLRQRVFESGEVPVLIVTTAQGEHRLRESKLPPSVHTEVAGDTQRLTSRAILGAVSHFHQSGLILVEGGPHLIGDLLAEQALDELFLTLAAQVVGRDSPGERPGFVAGRAFAPEQPLWSALVSVKLGGNHLLLRYAFEPTT